MTSDEEKRARLHAVCCDGCSIEDLEDDAGASPVIEEFHGDYDPRLPNDCYESASESGASLEGHLGADVGIDHSEEDCAVILSREKIAENLEVYVSEAEPNMEIDQAIDFAEGYLRIIQAPRKQRDYVLSLLEAELVSRIPAPKHVDYPIDLEDDPEDTDEEKFPQEELIAASRSIEDNLFDPEPVTIYKAELIELIDSYRADYSTKK